MRDERYHAKGFFTRGKWIKAVYSHLAAVWFKFAQDYAHQRAFAGAVLPEHDRFLPLFYAQIYVLEYLLRAKSLGDVF